MPQHSGTRCATAGSSTSGPASAACCATINPARWARYTSAESSDQIGNDEMIVGGALERGPHPGDQLRRGQQPGWFDHAPLAIPPFGLNRLQPRPLDPQVAVDHPHALAASLDLTTVHADPL